MAASKAIGFLNFKFGADLGGFDRAMKKAQKNLKRFGKNIERTGKNLTTSLTLPIVALGGASTKVFMDFEQAMLKVEAVSGATAGQMEMLTETAKRLGATTMFSASQVAELQLNLSKLGLTPIEIDKATESILQLSQATGEDLGETATVVASTMRAFGLTAEDTQRITDVMADSFSSTALDLNKFSTAMATLAPVAKESGVQIEQASALVGVLANNGVDASTAGTALRNIFLDLAKQGMSLDEAMIAINNSTDPLTTAFDMFGKRGATVATILSKNQLEIKKLTQDFIDSKDEAAGMADIMDRGLAGSMRKLKSQTEAAGIELGEVLAPTINKLAQFIGSLMDKFSGLSDRSKKFIVIVAGLVAAIGPALIIIGKMATGLAALIPIFKGVAAMTVRTLIPAFKRLFVVMMANPILATIGLLTALGVAIGSYISSSKKAKTAAQKQAEEERILNAELREREKNLRNIAAIDYNLEVTELKMKGASEAEIALKAVNFQLNNNKEQLKKLETGTIAYKVVEKQVNSLLEQKVELEKKIEKATKKRNKGTQELTNGIIDEKKEIKALNIELAHTKKINEVLIPKKSIKSFEEISGWVTKLTFEQELFNASMGLFGDVLTSSLDSALNSQEKFFDVFIKNIKRAIQSLLIQLAVMTLIQSLTGGGKAAFSLLNIKENLGSLLNIPAMADGGVVMGPQLSLIGEAGPEAVIPLDQLKNFGGAQQVEVVGKISGTDIFLSNRNTGTNRQRSV